MLPVSVAHWSDGGHFVSTRAGKEFVRSAEGAGPTILLLHGFPSSSL
jgi:hypothetical protein